MSEGWYLTAHDINFWADKEPRRAQEKLPLLVAKLIIASVKPSYICVPSKDAILSKGWDGIVEVETGNSFVPSGLSVWEFGTSKDYKKKANEDYKKRSKDPLEIDKTNATFVIVTSRIWEDKKNWEQEKNAEGKWKQVRVLDAVDLETWLHQCPAVHRWFARRMGKRPEGALDIEQAWDDWRFATEPPSNENLVIADRTEALENLIRKLKNNPSVIRVFGESKDEAYAFILASIIKKAQELIPRVLIISDAKEWLSAIESENPLILIPLFDNTMNWRLAVNQGHWVIVPESNPQNRNQDGNIVLSRPNRQSLIKAFIEMGIDEEKAQKIVRNTKGFITPLRRLLGDFKEPIWAKQNDSLIAALLIGAWDEKNKYDKEKVEKLAGEPYDKLEKILHTCSVGDDPPIRKVGSVWQVVSRQDMWQQLAPYISSRILEKFGQIAVEVLQEIDPRYELKPEERWLANIHGKVFKYSETIRKHIAEMLVMLAAYGDKDLRNTGETAIQDLVSHWVRDILLDDISAHRWYSLQDLLPYLAEAAPEVFLEAVEESLKGSQPPLMKLFVEEGDFGGCPHAGLLWALEGISWNLDYLPKVVLILAKLSRLDPGGRWSNRPFNTLRNIFLAWNPQTRTSVKERLVLLDLILSRKPEVGWKLLLSLIPKGVGEIAIPIHKPYFMDWAEGWKPGVTKKEYWDKEYWDYVSGISEKIKKYSMRNLERCLPELIEILEYLPEPAFDYIIKDLKASLDNISPEKRVEAYEKLFEIICKHKKFLDAEWVLPEEAIGKLEELLQRFTPDDPVNKNKILFNKWPHDIVCQPDIEYREAERIIEERRKSALEEIWKKQGPKGINRLVEIAKLPPAIGHSLAISSFSDEIEDIVLQWLDSENEKLSKVAQAYIYTKSNQDKNYPQTMFEKYKTEWNLNKWSKFCLALPFIPEVFDFIQNLPHEVEKIYWKNIQNFYLFEGSKEQAELVIRKLLENGRPIAALNAASQYLHTIAKESGLDVDLLVEVFEQVAVNPENPKLVQADPYYIEEVFEYLQKCSEIDQKRLARLEWLYVFYFWHNKSHIRVKPITLIKEVLNNADLFVQLIRWVYKSEPPIEGELSDSSLDQRKRLAENAYFLLDIIDKLPGQSGEHIDLTKLMEWIKHIREKCECEREDLLPICDEKIGEILSHAPCGEDGIWPHEVVRDVIEEISSRDLERGIEIGIYNQRGVVTKSLGEGGKQERKLAERYNQFADALKLKWPRTAVMLKRISQEYIWKARREDLRTELDDLL